MYNLSQENSCVSHHISPQIIEHAYVREFTNFVFLNRKSSISLPCSQNNFYISTQNQHDLFCPEKWGFRINKEKWVIWSYPTANTSIFYCRNFTVVTKLKIFYVCRFTVIYHSVLQYNRMCKNLDLTFNTCTNIYTNTYKILIIKLCMDFILE